MGCGGVTSGGGGGGAGGPGMDGFNDGSSLGCRGGDGGVGIQLNISGTQVTMEAEAVVGQIGE